jgi:hypothetical protein
MQASAEPRSTFAVAAWLWLVVTLAILIVGALVLR